MRRDFHPLLFAHMRADARIRVVLPDLGYRMFDEIAAAFPDRIWNVGAAECLALGIAVGLADEGLIPVVYSITPFLLYRPAEWIRNYLGHEGAGVKLLAAGRYEAGQEDYDKDGFTHHAKGDAEFLALFPNIAAYWPADTKDLVEDTKDWLFKPGPAYLNLRR